MEWRKPVVLYPATFLLALGLAWLFGTVRAGVLAQPEINWTLELLKLFVPPILTGLTVGLAAWLAYRYANRGRKEDILYKERYKSFEEVAGFLNEIIRKLEKLSEGYMGSNKQFVQAFITDRLETGRISTNLLTSQPNRRHLVLFGSQTRTSYYSTILLLENLIEMVDDKGDDSVVASYYEYEERAIEHRGCFDTILRQIIRQAERTLDSAKVDIDLPYK